MMMFYQAGAPYVTRGGETATGLDHPELPEDHPLDPPEMMIGGEGFVHPVLPVFHPDDPTFHPELV